MIVDSLNVSVLTTGLAEWMGVGARAVRACAVAELLHDLGRVRIRSEVLTRSGKLTDKEWIILRRHAVDGAKLIYKSDRDRDLAAAVADEHDTMINVQGYPHRHFERGLSHIETGAGADFEFASATAFCALMRQWELREAVLT